MKFTTPSSKSMSNGHLPKSSTSRAQTSLATGKALRVVGVVSLFLGTSCAPRVKCYPHCTCSHRVEESPKQKLIRIEHPQVQIRVHEIMAEIDALGKHDWAGVYGYGIDGYGFAIAPNAGFAYERWHCLGPGDLNYGAVAVVSYDRICIITALDPDLSGRAAINDTLIRVRWGDRHYLVPEHRMIAFCNHVNSGFHPRGSIDWRSPPPYTFLRRSDMSKPVSGLPEVPEEYRPWILAAPITTRITEHGKSVSSTNQRVTRTVTVDRGRDDGLRPGMALYLFEGGSFCNDAFTVLEAGPRTSTLKVTSHFSDEADTLPAVGTMLSTKCAEIAPPSDEAGAE